MQATNTMTSGPRLPTDGWKGASAGPAPSAERVLPDIAPPDYHEEPDAMTDDWFSELLAGCIGWCRIARVPQLHRVPRLDIHHGKVAEQTKRPLIGNQIPAPGLK